MANPRDARARLGRRCRQLRKDKGLSQMDMVRYADFSLSHYQKIERGDLDPRMSTLIRLARAFSVSLSELAKGIG